MTTDAKTMLELLPCPFCGSKIVHIESWARSFDPPRLYHEWQHADDNDNCWVRHRAKCVASATERPEDQHGAVERWNTRGLSVAAEAQVTWEDIARLLYAVDGNGFWEDRNPTQEAAYTIRAKAVAHLYTGETQRSPQTRPAAFLAWAREMFGPVAAVRGERLMRFVEEAIELAHADEMERATLDAIANRVYSRPPGEINKEIGQAQACLEIYAENIGESADDLAELEWQRVQKIPRAEWQRRHAAKQEIGIALSHPESKP